MYFESFPVLTLTVKVVDLAGQSKLKMIEATESIVQSSDMKFDEIWCVFDMNSITDFQQFTNRYFMIKLLGNIPTQFLRKSYKTG